MAPAFALLPWIVTFLHGIDTAESCTLDPAVTTVWDPLPMVPFPPTATIIAPLDEVEPTTPGLIELTTLALPKEQRSCRVYRRPFCFFLLLPCAALIFHPVVDSMHHDGLL